MFCNYCGTHNPDVAKFCRKCGKPTVNSQQPSAPAPPVAAAAPLIDPPSITAPVAETIHLRPIAVATLPPVLLESHTAKPRVVRATKRTTAAVAASVAVLLIGAFIFMRARSNRPRILTGHSGFIGSIAFSPDGRMLASGSSDGTVKLWDTAQGQWLRTLSSYQNTYWVTFSPNGHTLASSGGSSGHGLVLWDAASGNQVRVVAGDADFVGPPAFSPDGRLLVATANTRGTDDDGLRVWDAVSGDELRRFPGYAGPVFSPDGKTLAAWNKSQSITLLDVESGNEVRKIAKHLGFLPGVVAFSPDGHLLASTNDDAMITVWDVASWQEVRNISDSARVRGIAFSPDSRLLASGSEDHTIKLWDLGSGNKLRTFSGHSDSVNCVAFSADGRWLASGGADASVRLWPLPESR